MGDAVHLDDEEHGAGVTLPGRPCQLPQMLDSTGSGGIGEISLPIDFQSASLHLNEELFPVLFQIEVQAGIPEGVFGPEKFGGESLQPLAGCCIGRLAVDVHPAKAGFLNGDKVICGLPLLPRPTGQYHGTSRDEQLPAAPGVFDVDGVQGVSHLHPGNEAVGALPKFRDDGIGVPHGQSRSTRQRISPRRKAAIFSDISLMQRWRDSTAPHAMWGVKQTFGSSRTAKSG